MIEVKTEDYDRMIEQYPKLEEENAYVILKVPERIYYELVNRFDPVNNIESNYEISRNKYRSLLVQKKV